jgi:type II secretion system protein G
VPSPRAEALGPLRFITDVTRSVASLAPLDPAALLLLGERLVALRAESMAAGVAAQRRLLEAHGGGAPEATEPEPTVPDGWERVGELVLPEERGTVYQFEQVEAVSSGGDDSDVDDPDGPSRPGAQRQTTAAMLVPDRTGGVSRPANATDLAPTVEALLAWGREHAPEEATVAAVRLAGDRVREDQLTPEELERVGAASIERQRRLLTGFGQRMTVEPVGYLHLERLGFVPAGIERGELLHSVPLAPAEEVTISHKEWSNTHEEFQRIVTDFIEQYSEEGVAEKSELTQATSSQSQHSLGLNTSVTASGTYGAVNVTASAGLNVAESASQSAQDARNQSASITSKAANRTKQEHKISFKLASEAGTTDEAVRKLRNPFKDKATRIDYYQLVRKWKVDLYRYGIRLTYDLVIPEPGLDILTKIIEIQQIRAALQTGFGAPDATLPSARFDLLPTALTRANYATEAAKYNAVALEPPPATRWLVKTAEHSWSSFDESQRGGAFALEIEVDPSYVVDSAIFQLTSWEWPGYFNQRNRDTGVLTGPAELIGKSDKVAVHYRARYASVLSLGVQLKLGLSADAFAAWQLKAWSAIRDGAQNRYYEQRQMLKERLDQLTQELGAQDPLSLRKAEREEVMKGVLRWLFGPSFTFLPVGIPADLYESDGSIVDADTWAKLSALGEVVKFLHQAIEWENMLYFLYPYFWSNVARWDAKKYLDHPDALHRVFLKAGSARVVLTIRPGFEVDFLSVLETGQTGGSHPYVTIAQEMQAYAQTNYPGIRPANPVESARPLLTRTQRAAWSEMQQIEQLLEAYRADTGGYPSTAQGLAALKPYTSPAIPRVPTTDPWGHPYAYTSPGQYADYDLVSHGKEGLQGGEDENADITSWAEASLIGTWYEYTPTSAMDIAFNQTTPSA